MDKFYREFEELILAKKESTTNLELDAFFHSFNPYDLYKTREQYLNDPLFGVMYGDNPDRVFVTNSNFETMDEYINQLKTNDPLTIVDENGVIREHVLLRKHKVDDELILQIRVFESGLEHGRRLFYIKEKDSLRMLKLMDDSD